MQYSRSRNFTSLLKQKLTRGEFSETLCMEEESLLSCRFDEWKVRQASLVLRGSCLSVKCQVSRQEAQAATLGFLHQIAPVSRQAK